MSQEFNPVQTSPYSVGYKIKSRLWGVINSTIFRWTPFFMRKARVAMLRMVGANIDWSCSVSGSAEIVDPWNLTMGELSSIGDNCSIRCRGQVVIGKRCCISRCVDILSGSHNIFSKTFELVTAPVVIEDNVWIATKAMIEKGVTIGKWAVVGAGTIVNKDVPKFAIVEGNPGQVCAFRFKLSEILELCPELKNEGNADRAFIMEHYNRLYPTAKKSSNNTVTKQHIYQIDDYDRVFCGTLNVKKEELPRLAYKQSIEWDSVGHMSLIVSIEQKFGITLSSEDAMSFDSYKNGIEILKKYGVVLLANVSVVFPEKFFDFSGFKDNIAVQTETKSYTYSDLDDVCLDAKEKMIAGRLAILLAKNTIGSIASYTMCIKNNIPVAILDGHKDASVVLRIIQQYHPEYLILPTVDNEKYSGEVIGDYFDYSVVHLEKTSYKIYNRLSLLLTTSGSTGSPRFVRLSTKNIQSNAESIARYLNLNETERPITSLPMHYSYGISIINSHFVVGATIILTERSVVDKKFWETAKLFSATSVSGVPYTYEMFKQMRVMDMQLPSLKTFTQAGGKMLKDNIKFFADKCKKSGRKLIVMYGQTEASPRISYLPFESAADKSDSIGIAIPGVTLSVSDDGELICQGDNVFMGYAESYKDLEKEDEQEGILYTGDMARVDEDGYYYIIGRKKRFVKVYGNRVGLDELEQLIIPKYGKVVCVGVDDHITIYTTDKNVDLDLLIQYVSRISKINSKAFNAAYIENFPYSDTGKILYKKLNVIR